jgi:hypothetical protein
MANRASPCGIIDITSAVNAGQTATVTSVLDAFELVHVAVTGADGCVATVKKNGNIAAVATYHIEGGGDPTNSCLITNANAGFTTADALTIEVTGANATRVTLFTRYPDAYADVLTVVVA